MNIPKVSVIVAVYNAQNYLAKCIDSLLAQTLTEFEVLLINDGSTDNSGAICDEYSQKDERVRVFHKENGGVSSARNLGIKEAAGQYTIHLDSDDYTEPDMLEKMYNHAVETESDIIVADFFIEEKDKQTIIKQSIREFDNSEIIKQILNGSLHGSVWNKLIRASFYKNLNIEFEKNLSYCEDMLFNIECLLNNPKVEKIESSFVHYVQRENSLIRELSEKTFVESFKLIETLENKLGVSYQESINFFKLVIKRRMIISNLFSSKEIKNKYPEADKYIFKSTSLTWKMKLMLLATSNGFYFLIKPLLKIKKKLQ